VQKKVLLMPLICCRNLKQAVECDFSVLMNINHKKGAVFIHFLFLCTLNQWSQLVGCKIVPIGSQTEGKNNAICIDTEK